MTLITFRTTIIFNEIIPRVLSLFAKKFFSIYFFYMPAFCCFIGIGFFSFFFFLKEDVIIVDIVKENCDSKGLD